MESNKSKTSYKQGFTLIELLVVVLIIGILAAVAVPQYRVAVAKSKYASVKHLVKAVADAEEVFYLANGRYTTDLNELDVNFPQPDHIEDEDNPNYIYSWGYCGFAVDHVGCMVSAGGLAIRYLRFFNHIEGNYSRYKGKQMCQALRSQPLEHRICQQDSGLSVGDGNWYAW